MPQELDTDAMKSMTEIILPSARLKAGNSVAGISVGPSGKANVGTLPHRDIPHFDFPRVVYFHPRKPYRKMILPVDGHGNKEWQWVANQVKTKTVQNKEELAAAQKEGYQLKHYVVPPPPLEQPEEETAEVR